LARALLRQALAVHACGKSPDGLWVPLLDSPGGLAVKPEDLTTISLDPYSLFGAAWTRIVSVGGRLNPAGVVSSLGQVHLVTDYGALARMGWGEWIVVDDDIFAP
jgi:hypothetical protein